MSDDTTYHLCVSCGCLKADELFEQGDCTCNDCYEADEATICYEPNPDGDGWVMNQ